METESLPCRVCSQLLDQESASQKYGWSADDTSLPHVILDLKLVRDMRLGSERALQLWHCPLCGNYYLYETDYEYLVNGSEDEQSLTRLSAEEARQYLT
jgi:hypothetical protein